MTNFTFYEFKKFEDKEKDARLFNSKCKLISLIDKFKETNKDDLTKFALSKNLKGDGKKCHLIFYIDHNESVNYEHSLNTKYINIDDNILQAIIWLYTNFTANTYEEISVKYFKTLLKTENIPKDDIDKFNYNNKYTFINIDTTDTNKLVINFKSTQIIKTAIEHRNSARQNGNEWYAIKGEIKSSNEGGEELIRSNIYINYYSLLDTDNKINEYSDFQKIILNDLNKEQKKSIFLL